VDVLVANNNDPPLLLHNRGGAGNHFVNFKLIGTKSNRDATGARIWVRANGTSQIREIMAGGSYLSHSDLRAHFGIGPATLAETVEVSWPSGLRQAFRSVKVDQFYVIQEGREPLRLQKIQPRLPVSCPSSLSKTGGNSGWSTEVTLKETWLADPPRDFVAIAFRVLAE